MVGFRKAFLLASVDRYTNLILNFVLIAVISRLLPPSEIGVAAFGTTLTAFIENVRDVASVYLVQQKRIDEDDVRTAHTVMLLLTLCFSLALLLGSSQISLYYNDGRLSLYVQVLAIALLTGPFERPLNALLRRDMRFDKIAIVNISGGAVNVCFTLGLAAAGFGYMSFAWALLISNLIGLVLLLWFQPNFRAFLPQLKYWRRAYRFGGVTAFTALLSQLNELTPYFILSRVFNFNVVGYYSRTLMVGKIPNNLLMTGLAPVLLPAFASEARAGGNLKAAFLNAVSLLSAAYWPAYLLVAMLAHPAVLILVGSQWISIVPAVQILAVALLFSFGFLISPVLLATGALRQIVTISLITVPTTAIVNAIAAIFGVKAIMLSMLITVPFYNFVALTFLQRIIGFTWGEFFGALRKSAVVALFAIFPPALAVAWQNFNLEISIERGVGLGLLSILSWLVGIFVLRHPFADELTGILTALRARLGGRGLPGLILSSGRRK